FVSEHRLDKIIIERPRYGSHDKAKKVQGYRKRLYKITQEAQEDGYLQPYLFKPQKTRILSDNLAPLYRWLRSKVGQPWDNVYSQLCQQLETNSVIGQHILHHLWDIVKRHVEIRNNDIYAKHKSKYPLISYGNRPLFYVHPETGIFCLAPRKQKSETSSQDDVVIINRYQQYRRIDDIWYFVSFKDVKYSPKNTEQDILCDRILDPWEARKHYGKPISAYHKRHATKKEIKTLKKRQKC
ncbi:MAG: hypothetical protein ACLFT0_21305, partial [Spirulinaceae cyanobacterium]